MLHAGKCNAVWGSRLLAEERRKNTREAGRPRGEDFQTSGPTLSSGAPHAHGRGKEELERKHHAWESGCKKFRTENIQAQSRHVHDEHRTELNAPSGFSERNAKGACPLKFPIWGSSKRVRRWKQNAVPDMGLEPMIFSPAAGQHTRSLTARQRGAKLSRGCPFCRPLLSVRVPRHHAGADARLPPLADGGLAGGRRLCAHQDQHEAVRFNAFVCFVHITL